MTVQRDLLAHLPRLSAEWDATRGDDRWRIVDGTLLFVDVSGFTKLSERLARHGKVGAEEVADVIGTCFAELLAVAYDRGGSLLKFGGDALLLLFDGVGHAPRATSAAIGMHRRLRDMGTLTTTAGGVTLRMSAGVHSGELGCFLVGESHRELLLVGPGITTTTAMEKAASAGEVIVSPATAAQLPDSMLGAALGPGVRIRRGAVPLEGMLTVVPRAKPDFDVSPFLPLATRQHLQAGGGDPEHRQVTVAFLHFDGTDELFRREGAAAVADALEELVVDVQRAVDEREVTFLGTDVDADGGKIILTAGAPRRVGRDEDRLLAAVHTIFGGTRRLAIRAGVHRGSVFAGNIGPAYRRTYTVMGDAVNLSARLMARAEPGHVITTPAVLVHTATEWTTTALEPFTVKGKRHPIEAFVLGAPKRRVVTSAPSLPLVGRAHEIATLETQLAAVVSGAGRLVEIVGNPGIGKSRLADELRQRAEPHMPHMTVTCDPYESSTPYGAFWWLLHDLLGVAPDAAPDVVAANLEHRVREAAPHLEPWLPLVATPLDLDLPDTPETASLEPAFRHDRVNEVTAALIDALMPAPVLVVAEDVQWMDSASQAVLAIIADALRHRNALVCVTRHDTTDGFQTVAAPHVCTLAPAPLTDAEAAAALVAATEDAPLRPDEIATLASRAAGNPLFLSAVLAAAGTTSNVAALPDSVDAVLTAQVDRLPPTHQQLLRSASVLGRTFSRHELHAVVERDHAVIDDDMWTELSDFLTLTGSDTVAFRHGLLRDAVYEGLPFRRRRELHARAAEAIAARLGAHAETEAELLSLHCFHAQRFMDAWRFAGIAGARAFDKYANAEAAELLERAVASAKHTRGEVPDAEIAAVLEQLGDARDRAGIYDRALTAYHSARRLRIDDIAGQVALLVKEADIAQRTGHYRRVITIAKRGLRLLDRAEIEGGGTRARLKIWYAIVREFQGRVDEAATLCSEAVADAVAAGDLPAEAQSRLILDWIQVERGRHDLATHSPRALAIYEELGDVGGQALVLNNLGAFAYWEGRWTDAVALYEQGRAARLVTGNAVDAASGTMNIGEVYADQGRLDEAEQCFRDAWRVWRSVCHAGGSALTTMHLGRIAAKRGDFAEAFALLDAAREEFLAIGSTNDVLEVDTRTAECRILAGEYETALGVADRELAASHGLVEETALLRIRGTALLALGRADEGIAALRSCLDESRSRGARFEIALAQHELVDAYFARGDLASAEEAEREATAIFAELGVTRAPIRRARAAAYLPT